MAIIYLTINMHNELAGINPYKYLGSDQYDNPNYLGSNKKLKEDIDRLGKENFKKITLDTLEVDNKTLRQKEAELLKKYKVKSDATYYNESELYAPGGGKKGMKHTQKFARTDKWKKSRKGYAHTEISKKMMADKKIGKKLNEGTKKLMSIQRSGDKNPNALQWEITTPWGQKCVVKGLAKYCKDVGVDYRTVYHSKNGWVAVKNGKGKGGRTKNVKI